MLDETLMNAIEQVSTLCIDIDEKSYQELGEFLNKMDIVMKPIMDSVPESVTNSFNSVLHGVEALILQEIDPIDDFDSLYDEIYTSFEQLKEFFYTGKIPENAALSKNDQKNNVSGDVLSEQEVEIEDDMFSDFLEEAAEYIDDLENGIIALEEKPRNTDIINEVFRPFHTLKGVSGFMGLHKMNKVCHETESLLDMARNKKLIITTRFIDAIFKAIDVLKIILSKLKVDDRTEKIDDEHVDKIINILGNIEKDKDLPQENNIENEDFDDDFEEPAQEKKSKQAESSIKIKTEKLDYLINTVGELLIASNLIRQDKHILSNNDQIFTNKIGQLARVVSELQTAAMALRMVPIGTTFQKMKRVVRDLSKKTKKGIQLILDGEETEIDRHLVDSLYDPLVHMIRNSCDHGIEAKEDRIANGKTEIGTINLNAYHKGNNFIIDVKDDGKGLDKNRIFEKAVERKLISENEKLSDDQIYKLVFLPGFSTAQQVTDVSGRGVGMDVVVQSIKSLGGDITIKSATGLGTTFSMSIPLTLAIIEGLQVKVAEQLFVIPITQVNRFVRPEMSKINSVIGQGQTIQIEDQLIPILSLEKAFAIENTDISLEDSLLVVVTSGMQKFALRVDQILTIQDIVVKNLGEKFRDLKGVSGATILGDGSVGLILDVNQLFLFK